jgi:predicted Zn-dependent protease
METKLLKLINKKMNLKRIGCILTAAAILLAAHPAGSITIKEEEEMAQEFLRVVQAYFPIVRDPTIAAYVDNLGRKILASFPEQPFHYRFFVIKDDVYNAFATPAGNVFVYTGLIAAMNDEEELAGILAHEIAHVYCRHISQKIERSKKINMATLAGIAAGLFLGAAGGGAAASTVTMGSLAAGQSAELAYSRENEIQADQIGLDYLNKAGYSGQGLMDILNKIRAKQWYGSDIIPQYLMTHPAVEDRIAYLDTLLASRKVEIKPPTAEEKQRFQLVKTRVVALYGDQTLALRQFEGQVKQDPSDSLAHYGYGLTLARTGNTEAAISALKKTLETNAFNPDYLTALGRTYFQAGQYQDALDTLKSAISIQPANPESQFFLGRTQLETGDLSSAGATFENLLRRYPDFIDLNYYLGIAYGKMGKLGPAHYHLGIYHYKKMNFENARVQFEKATENGVDPNMQQEIDKALKEIGEIEKKKKKG